MRGDGNVEMYPINHKVKKRKTMTTSIDEELHYRFKIKCAEREIKMNDALENLLKVYLESSKEGESSGIPNK